MSKVQPGVMEMLLTGVFADAIASISGKNEEKVVAVAVARFLAECPTVLANEDGFAKLLSATVVMLEKPEELKANEEELDDDGAALRWLRLAADGGDTSAMVTLGYRHRFGEGVPQDLSEMLRWYRAAAAEEDPTAIANLAICYQNGEGVRQDEARAHGLREQAAGLGHPGSEIWLAFALVDGTGCEPDPEAGRGLLEGLAAENSEVAHDLGLVGKDAVENPDSSRGTDVTPKRRRRRLLRFRR